MDTIDIMNFIPFVRAKGHGIFIYNQRVKMVTVFFCVIIRESL